MGEKKTTFFFLRYCFCKEVVQKLKFLNNSIVYFTTKTPKGENVNKIESTTETIKSKVRGG